MESILRLKWFAALVCLFVVVILMRWLEYPVSNSIVVAENSAPESSIPLLGQSVESIVDLKLSSRTLPPEIDSLVIAGNFERAKTKLLQQATHAVKQADENKLAQILSYLGEITLLQGELESAEIYLTESIELFDQVKNEVAAGGVYQQLGRLHLVVRQRARLASSAYDTLLIARWKIGRGEFNSAEADLRRAAADNLSLNRFGAAASVYETLFRGYSNEGNVYEAQLAGIEAAKLHASSGRNSKAVALLNKMQQIGLSDQQYADLEVEIGGLNDEYKRSVLAMGVARDQAQLYNQLLAQGDLVNAWRFRQKASASRAKVSARAQYRRQADVLVQLYKSNNNIENAKAYFQRAQEVYLRNDIDTTSLQSLQEQVF